MAERKELISVDFVAVRTSRRCIVVSEIQPIGSSAVENVCYIEVQEV